MTRHKKHQGKDMRTLGSQLRKGSELVVLAADEQALMRERLVSYMEYKPLRRPEPAKAEPVTSLANRVFSSFFGARHLSGALAIALIATMSTYSVSSAAAESLPGDLLYPVKVHVNEGVKTVFVSGDEARIAWERERAEMRLQEAGTLASQGRLDAERQEVVAKQFAVHTDAVAERVRAVEESDPVLAAEASAEMADALDTQKAVLARLIVEQEEGGMVDEGARELVKQIHVAAQEAVVLRDEAEANLAFEDDVPEPVTSEDNADISASENVVEETFISGDEDEIHMPAEEAEITQQDSATKERAASRAKARATAGLERAEGLLTARVGESELTASARTQIDAGAMRLEEADTAFAEGRLGAAYSAYRHAASIFQKVAKVLEVSDSLTVDLSASTLIDTVAVKEVVAEPLEDELRAEDAIEPASEEVSIEPVPVSLDRDLAQSEQQARSALEEVRAKMNALEEGVSEQAIAGARGALKDASASIMNAEIALSLGNSAEAHAIYIQAEGYARAGLSLLAQSSEAEGDRSPTSQVDTSADAVINEQTSDTLEGDPLMITHNFEVGIHTYGGVMTVDTCTNVLRADVVAPEALDTQLVLNLTTEPVERDGACGEQGVSFRATTSAPEEADLVGVTLDGERIAWVVSEPEGVVEVPEVRSASTTNGSTSTMFRRAFEGAQGLFTR